MNSINRNQPEKNRADLRGSEALEKIRELVGKAKNCFFCTTAADGRTGTRPMNVRKVDDRGDLWFLSASDSQQKEELARDPSVQLYFQGSSHSDFLHLRGRATISTDRSKVDELWEPVIKTWFTGGKDDPRITVIRVTPTDGYYWDTKHGNTIAAAKMLLGAAIGTTLDDSIEGTLSL